MKNHCFHAGLALASASIATPLMAAEEESENKESAVVYEEVRIIGSPEQAEQLAGSGFVVTDVELKKFSYGDIHSVLQSVPGVYIQQEEGYGLRPNIGIRGASSSRSEQVTLMEDGVLIAPAPYSAPSAYYTPTFSRMAGIEVLKGPETIQYGPATVGGSVNMISTPIPTEASGRAAIDIGEQNEQRLHVWYGDSAQNFGWLVETTQYGADGYKDIDRSSDDTGFDIEDYMVKLRVNSDPGQVYHQFDLKLQHSTELSDQSYMGLTYDDFRKDPNRQYGLTSEDEMDNEHTGVSATYLMKWQENLTFSATAYFNNFKRDWFKVNDKIGDFSQAQLDGTANASGIEIKHNNREYDSYGLQTKLNILFQAFGGKHDLDIGLRLHEDETDRFQPVEIWNQTAGQMVSTPTVIAPVNSNNRIEEAEALSFYVMDHIEVNDKLNVTAGIRYEDVETKQTRYLTPDRSTSSVANKNSFDDIILGLGATYQLNDFWQLLAGVHEGFAVPNAGSTDTEPASGVNYEYGVRFKKSKLNAELIAFFSENESTIQNCSLVNPCGALTSGSTSLGESEINGLELAAQYDFASSSTLQLPLRVSYTYTDAEITDPKNNPSTQKGDPILNIPENQLSVQFGVAHEKGWDVYLNGSYTDSMCNDYSCDIDVGTETQELVVWDLAGGYQLTEELRLNARIDNLLDRQEIVSWNPDGARPNKPRTAYLGLVYDF